MQIYGLFTSTGAARATATGASTATDGVNGENKAPTSIALRLLASNESNAERAALAKKKLDEIKEQLRMLRFWASDPETLARLAKQLAQQLGTVAQQLAGAGASGGASASGAATAAAATLAGAGNAQGDGVESGDTQPGETQVDETQLVETRAAGTDTAEDGASSPDRSTFAERAYREFDGDHDRSDSTASVAAELKSVAEQVKQLLRKAEQDLRAKGSGRGADEARAAGHALSAAVGKLGSSDASTTSPVVIPTSVSV
ncbi:MAG TPA: hypothetical protein VGO04_12850 [Ensifer sp.]|jgi:hypothetical protein|uniref:hypothetical protein n=1 Tax=Ensifer sp. TaxID=1872086 RepID=UPI002E144F86|nr:hypothetical protein [Ensifer sp.]